MLQTIEKLLELTVKVSCIIFIISFGIWAYRENTFTEHKDFIFMYILMSMVFLSGAFFIINRFGHQAVCRWIGVKFPYILFLIPFVIMFLFMAIATTESAYYGYNANLNR